MSKIKILIVEDELIIAEDMKEMLQELDYEVIGIAKGIKDAEELLNRKIPDIALIDIRLYEGDDGIQLAINVKERFDIPIIFVTSNTDKATVERAKEARPNGFIVKPFEKEDLYTSIEIAFSNYIGNQTNIHATKVFENENSPVVKNSIFVKKDHLLIKIRFDELKWIKAERNYVELHCDDKMHLTRSTLKEFLDKLPQDKFIQVQRSYAVNIDHITALEYSALFIGRTEIPLGRGFFEAIKSRLDIEM